MFLKLLGVGFYCLGLGAWIISLFVFSVWATIFILPGAIICFAAGYTVNILGRTSEWHGFRYHRIWNTVRYLFNFQLEYVHEKAEPYLNPENLEKKTHVIWGIYPHGHFSLTHAFYFILNPKFKDVVPVVHSVLFYLPILGSLMGWIGAVPATEFNMKNVIHTNRSIVMAPGGISDSYLLKNNIRKHHGFLRIAHETYATVIPVWCADERSYFHQWLPFGWTLEKYLFFPIPMFVWGYWWCPFNPKIPPKSRIFIGEPVVFWNDKVESRLTLEQGEKQYWAEIARLQELA